MDKVAQQALDASSHSGVSKTGGQEYNSPHHSGQGDGSDRLGFKPGSLLENITQHGLSLSPAHIHDLLSNRKEHEKPVNDEELAHAHDQAYNKNNLKDMSSKSIGSAAAMQVIKQFISGGSSSGGSKEQLVNNAIAEGMKLFAKAGGSGNKEDVVSGAVSTVMSFLTSGGSNFGGLGGLANMFGN